MGGTTIKANVPIGVILHPCGVLLNLIGSHQQVSTCINLTSVSNLKVKFRTLDTETTANFPGVVSIYTVGCTISFSSSCSPKLCRTIWIFSTSI